MFEASRSSSRTRHDPLGFWRTPPRGSEPVPCTGQREFGSLAPSLLERSPARVRLLLCVVEASGFEFLGSTIIVVITSDRSGDIGIDRRFLLSESIFGR